MDLICTTCRQSFTATRRWWMVVTGLLLTAGFISAMFESAAADRRVADLRAQWQAEGATNIPASSSVPPAVWIIGICLGVGFLIVGLRQVRACPHCTSKATVPEESPAGMDLLRQRNAKRTA